MKDDLTLWDNGQLLRQNAGQTEHQEHAEALFLTSSFTFGCAAEAAEKFAEPGAEYIYSRFSNPTVSTFNRRIAIVEGGEFALSTASGMAAILTIIMGVCQRGNRVLCAANVFGSTLQLLAVHIAKFGVSVEFVATPEPAVWRELTKQGGVALIFLETPSNPMQTVFDLAAMADVAHSANALLVVDNCFCAGLQQPLRWGADVVIHSGTKYLDGQGRVLGGAIVGQKALLMERCYPFLRAAGPALSPFNAWILAKGMETLSLRMRQHSESALAIAEWLEAQPLVQQVWHTALASHPTQALAMRQQNGRGGGLITFAIDGDRAATWRFIDALKRFSITANFGDTKSTVVHPPTTTHQRLSPAERDEVGLTDSVVRLSIGLEQVEALVEDLSQAFAAVSQGG